MLNRKFIFCVRVAKLLKFRLYVTNKLKYLFFAKNSLMKKWLIAFGIFISVSAHAQFGFYGQGGVNYSHLGIKGDETLDSKGGFGGQIGGGIEYYTHFNYFVYVGLNLAYENFKLDSSGTGFSSVVTTANYKPLFISIPFGVAYQFDFSKNLGLKLYGGMDVQFGVGGKVDKHRTYYTQDSTTGEPIKVRESFDSHSIAYGRTSNKGTDFDLANANMGFNLGAGLNFNKSIEVYAMYRFGLKNVLPGGESATEQSWLSQLQLNFKIYLPQHYYRTAKEKPYSQRGYY
jgi:hypothetical protein